MRSPRCSASPPGARARGTPPAPDVASRRRALRVLVAEDNMVNRKLVTTLLHKRGHKVKAVENGRAAVDAISAARGGKFDVVLMDLQMPEMSGFEATQAIRQEESPDGRHLPIIALTAHAMQGDRERCLAAGMDGYLSKPIDVDAAARDRREIRSRRGGTPCQRNPLNPSPVRSSTSRRRSRLHRAAIASSSSRSFRCSARTTRRRCAASNTHCGGRTARRSAWPRMLSRVRSRPSVRRRVGNPPPSSSESARSGDLADAKRAYARLATEPASVSRKPSWPPVSCGRRRNRKGSGRGRKRTSQRKRGRS